MLGDAVKSSKESESFLDSETRMSEMWVKFRRLGIKGKFLFYCYAGALTIQNPCYWVDGTLFLKMPSIQGT